MRRSRSRNLVLSFSGLPEFPDFQKGAVYYYLCNESLSGNGENAVYGVGEAIWEGSVNDCVRAKQGNAYSDRCVAEGKALEANQQYPSPAREM